MHAYLGSACGATGVKEQCNILLLGSVYQFSRRLLHLEAFSLGLDVHCMTPDHGVIGHSVRVTACCPHSLRAINGRDAWPMWTYVQFLSLQTAFVESF